MTEYTFVRHGNTTSAEKDADCRLTVLGGLQAAVFKAKAEFLGIGPFDLALHSPTERAKTTAQLIAPGVKMIELLELGVDIKDEDGRCLEEAYNRLKYAPLGTYLLEKEMWRILTNYGENAKRTIVMTATSWKAERVLVVGHAVLLNAIGVQMTNDVESTTLLICSSLGECEGFHININNRNRVVSLITNP